MRAAELLILAGLCALLCVTSSLKICAFNVQSFGPSKANNQKVMTILLKILSRCDLCLIQEVRDSKGAAVQALVEELNRSNVLKVKDHYQYPELEGEDPNETNVFSRGPFIIRFQSPTTLVKDFVLIGHHTSPKTAMKEIDELYTVVNRVHQKWNTDNVIILGDLNAGCAYVTMKGLRDVRLKSDPQISLALEVSDHFPVEVELKPTHRYLLRNEL
ncbi:Deoxyribonuclease gamma [Oryzias melastigma]|uniref:Deoxyribonuclease gamma n=1 Tax=Oryzias melastigma TaxID=30732 RepID=A0A834C800_ORYME|nr:Deoxyribonuclease gamma [Oryzias melastigma]